MVGRAVGRVGETPRFGDFPSLCIRPPASVDATTYREAICVRASIKCSEAGIGMISLGGNDLFGRKISRTATLKRPFLSTFGWIEATPRQLQRPHAIRTRWVSRRGTERATRQASVLFLVAVLDFFH